jgi:MoxR-like ATPase
MNSIQQLCEQLVNVGYSAGREVLLAVLGALNLLSSGQPGILLITGAPGVGKTFLAESLAKALNANLVYGLLHSWSDDQELFSGIDVASAVAGDAGNVRQPGLLARAAELSQRSLTILCLD